MMNQTAHSFYNRRLQKNVVRPYSPLLAMLSSLITLLFLFTAIEVSAGIKNEKTTSNTKSPDIIIEQTTKQMLQVIRKNRETFQNNPSIFYSEVEKVLNPVIAFDQFSRGVMGKYAHRATEEQRKSFSKIFKQSLITFYGKAVMIFDTNNIIFDPVQAVSKEKIDRYNQKKSRSVPIDIKLRSNNREYSISYSLIKINNDWKVRNIVVEGVNIGIQFRNQFSEAIVQYKTIDGVIANWSSIMRTQFHDQHTTEKS